MADNRMYLCCKGCGAKILLGKRFVTRYGWVDYEKLNGGEGKHLEERLNEFYDNHDICTINGEINFDHFGIEYEDEGEWVEDKYTRKCSVCGSTYWRRGGDKWNYCPNCGSRNGGKG